jgi:hypothetical protein
MDRVLLDMWEALAEQGSDDEAAGSSISRWTHHESRVPIAEMRDGPSPLTLSQRRRWVTPLNSHPGATAAKAILSWSVAGLNRKLHR